MMCCYLPVASSSSSSSCSYRGDGLPQISCCNSHSKKRMMILGFGYVGQFLAQELKKKDDWMVSGTCTSTVKKKKLESMGFDDVQLFNQNEPLLISQHLLVDATHLLVSVPPVGDPVLHRHQDLLQTLLCNGNLKWLCYLSSTSVYGDCGGAWVDEDYPPKPVTDSAKARLAAEKVWLSLGHDLGVSVQVLRLGGIYGPGRSALDTIIKSGSMTENQRMRETRRYTSRVHVADICQALVASMTAPSSGKVYNIVDDDPASRADVFAFAQTLVEAKWPEQIKAGDSFNVSGSVNQGVMQGEKRVSNARLKNELGVRLLHPSYRSGLKSIIESMDEPFH